MKNLYLFLFVILFNPIFPQTGLSDKYDVKQYIIDIQVNNNSYYISGNVTTVALTTAYIDTFSCDLINTISAQTYMLVDSVFVNGVSGIFVHQNHCVKIPLSTSFQSGELFQVKIYYHGKATSNAQTDYSGINMGSYAGKTLACTFSEPDGSRIWWPCKQSLTDKADSLTMYITTSNSNLSGSNGKLTAVDSLPNNLIRYTWKTKHPIDFYLISFSVGPYDCYETYSYVNGGQDSVLLYNLLVSNGAEYPFHLQVIEKTKKLMELYSTLICDYPFKDEKYGYSIYGYGYGAMEHQTLTTIGALAMDTTAVDLGTYNYWYTAHELGHMWFGDYVTCSTWNDIWLNEGFASYLEYIALQNLESQTSADLWMTDAHTTVKAQPGGSVFASWDYRLMYKKGGALVHILRYEINNDSLFFAVLRNYLNAFQFSVASVNDFKSIAESTTGMDFTNFFNQWYYGEGYPIFIVNWNQTNDTLTIVSDQATSSVVTPLYNTHVDVKINSVMGDTTIRVYQGSNHEVYKIPYSPSVSSIEIDPENWLIKSCNIISGTGEDKYKTGFECFPNPFEKNVTIKYYLESPAMIKFEIINNQGRIVECMQIYADWGPNFVTLGETVQKGFYLIKGTINGRIVIQKLIKN